jgi:hypothetical protein
MGTHIYDVFWFVYIIKTSLIVYFRQKLLKQRKFLTFYNVSFIFSLIRETFTWLSEWVFTRLFLFIWSYRKYVKYTDLNPFKSTTHVNLSKRCGKVWVLIRCLCIYFRPVQSCRYEQRQFDLPGRMGLITPQSLYFKRKTTEMARWLSNLHV